MIEGLDGIDCEGCGQTAVSDVDPGRTVFVHPASFPTAVFLLESEKGSKVHFVPDSNGCASKDTHGEGKSITFRSYPFLDALAEDRAEGKIGFSTLDLFEETSHEKQEAFWSGIVAGAIGIPPIDEDFSDPCESSGEFIAAPIGVEEGEDIYTDNWVEAQSPLIKICLGKRVT